MDHRSWRPKLLGSGERDWYGKGQAVNILVSGLVPCLKVISGRLSGFSENEHRIGDS